MNIEVGKWYWCHNKNEGKRFVVGKTPDGSKLVVVDKHNTVSIRTIDGIINSSNMIPSRYDLVEEVKPERWVGLHRYGVDNIGLVGNLDARFTSEEEVINWYKQMRQFDSFIKAVKIE